MEARAQLPSPCPSAGHGVHPDQELITIGFFDPDCSTCRTRYLLSEHDHLHLAPPYRAGCPECSKNPLVKCRCGSYH